MAKNPYAPYSTQWWQWQSSHPSEELPHDPSVGFPSDDSGKPISTSNDSGASYDDFLRLFGGDQDEFTAFLQSLGISDPNKLTDAQRTDFNKQLIDQLIAHQSELDKRKYNESLRDEQRLYDSAMLARLMASGMSRDAALAMLSGSGGSGGSAAPYTDGTQLAQGLAPSESQLNKIQGDTSIANTVFNGLSAITGLVNMGFGCAATKAQTAFMKAQNVLTGKQINAFNIASKAFGVLNGVGAAMDAFGSVASAIQAIQQAAESGDTAAADFIQSGGIQQMRDNAPFVSRTLGQLYQDERSSKDYATNFDQLVRKNNADILLTEADVKSVLKGIEKCEAEINEIVGNTEFVEANKQVCFKQADYLEEQAKLAKKQGRLIDAQTMLTAAEKLRTDAESMSTTLQNQYVDALQNDTYTDRETGEEVSGLDLMTGTTIQNLFGLARTLAKTTSSEYIDAETTMQLSNFETITAANILRTLRANSNIKFANEHPETVSFGWALEDCGIGSLLRVNSKDAIGSGSFLDPELGQRLMKNANRFRQLHMPLYY